jgi:predicted CoA-binding protein
MTPTPRPPISSPPADADIRDILARARTIAVVGLSANPDRPSHAVAAFLAARGHRIVGVNPGLAGQRILGEEVRATLSDIPFDIDMVDIFRRSELVLPVVEEALVALPGLRTVWMQLGVENEAAAALARAKGVSVIQNRCPAIEIPRLRICTPAGAY